MQLPWLLTEGKFKWQGFYGAFTVSRWDVDKIVAYVKRQKEHHATDDLLAEYEAIFETVDTHS